MNHEYILNLYKDRTDKNGVTYLYHLFDVVLQVAHLGRAAAQVALLHDVVEDGLMTEEELRREVSSRVADCVMILTRREQEWYTDYISRIIESEESLAVVVKIADLRSNLREARKAGVKESLRDRYKIALARLEEYWYGTDGEETQ